MSEEYDNDSTTFSPFYPLLVLLVFLLIWVGYQVFAANSQRSVFAQQFQAAVPTINQAQNIKDRYVALMKDLIETAGKDDKAAAIVKEATQAGLLRVQQPEGGSATNAAPAPDAAAPAPAPAANK